jgi:hypothetical protein
VLDEVDCVLALPELVLADDFCNGRDFVWVVNQLHFMAR